MSDNGDWWWCFSIFFSVLGGRRGIIFIFFCVFVGKIKENRILVFAFYEPDKNILKAKLGNWSWTKKKKYYDYFSQFCCEIQLNNKTFIEFPFSNIVIFFNCMQYSEVFIIKNIKYFQIIRLNELFVIKLNLSTNYKRRFFYETLKLNFWLINRKCISSRA